MTNELLNIIISAVTGAIAGGVVNWLLELRKERREDKKEKENEWKESYKNRPELKIEEYKNYLDRPGYGIKKQCDINIFLAKIERVSIENGIARAHFREGCFNEQDWCCVIYSFKNVGKTDIQYINPICMSKRNTVLYDVDMAKEFEKYGCINYSSWYDKKIRVGETFTMKVCYYKESILSGMFSANMVMGFEDGYTRFWTQPLFAPDNKIYDADRVSGKEYKEILLPDAAIECFENPGLW